MDDLDRCFTGDCGTWELNRCCPESCDVYAERKEMGLPQSLHEQREADALRRKVRE